MRQAIFIALGLALGVGLVITVTAASDGVSAGQGAVLKSLYGVGTDITVTKSPTAGSGGGPGFSFRGGSGQGTNVSRDILTSAGLGTIKSSSVTTVSKLKDVSAAVGSLTLNDVKLSGTLSINGSSGAAGGSAGGNGNGTANGTKIDISSCTGTSGQQWTTGPDGTVRVNGKCLDVQQGGTASGTLTPTHAYQDAGTYTVTLVVTDSLGRASQASTTTATTSAARAGTARTRSRGNIHHRHHRATDALAAAATTTAATTTTATAASAAGAPGRRR